MNYRETLNYLYTAAPLFQNIGAGAYKEGLENSRTLDVHFGHPHRVYRTIHVAGTNGKGSTSHTLAALLQAAGYRVGLYTSPHLLDFRERIRVNGNPIPEQRVVSFVADECQFFESLSPSFFEITTALAFLYFAEQKVDVAVIEVGMGGRLDCTNIITPVLSVITNISYDHIQFLGDTLPAIAAEKAGIIKAGVPVVVGQAVTETRLVFYQKAALLSAPIFFAEEEDRVIDSTPALNGGIDYVTKDWGRLHGEVGGSYQLCNTRTILSALAHLPSDMFRRFTPDIVRQAFATVCETTGFSGRWQKLSERPLLIADTGHNVDAWRFLAVQLRQLKAAHLHMVFGVCADKAVDEILALLPKEATYYFSQATVKRALPAETLLLKAQEHQLQGQAYVSVAEALQTSLRCADAEDLVFIGGSSFVVADALKHLSVGDSSR